MSELKTCWERAHVIMQNRMVKFYAHSEAPSKIQNGLNKISNY